MARRSITSLLERVGRRVLAVLTPRHLRDDGTGAARMEALAAMERRLAAAGLMPSVAHEEPGVPTGPGGFVLLDLRHHDVLDEGARSAIASVADHARRSALGMAVMPPPAALERYIESAGEAEHLSFIRAT
jgi:hypothetical protein